MSTAAASAASAVADILARRRARAAPSNHQGGLLRQLRRQASAWRGRRRRRVMHRALQKTGAQAIVKRIPPFRGEFELDPNNEVTQRLLLGAYEEGLIPIVEAALKPGDHALDIGANLGLYTVLMGKLVGDAGRLLSAEPTPAMVRALQRNIARNELRNVAIFAGAVNAAKGPCTFHFVEGAEEYSSLGALVHPNLPSGQKREVTVPGETLDDLVIAHDLRPALIKVHTEGAEGLVFSGAVRTLAAARPVVLSELDDRLLRSLSWTSARVVELLMRHDYDVFDADSGQPLTGDEHRGDFIGEVVALPRAS